MSKLTRPLRPEALQTLIETSGLEFDNRYKKAWRFDCPKCGKKERLYIRRRDGRFICWYCRDKTEGGFEGDPEYALSLLLGRSTTDIQDIIYGPEFTPTARLNLRFWGSVRPYVREDEDLDDDELELPEDVANPLVGIPYPPHYISIFDPKAELGQIYLHGRGVTPELAKVYQLMYDPMKRRVVFPVVTRGVMVGWQARTCGPSEWVDDDGRQRKIPKILTTIIEGTRDNVLMFEHRLEGSDHAVLAEGPFDALKLHLCGGNVCSMGKSVAPGQVERLKAFGIKKLYLAQDPDAHTETRLLNRKYCKDFEIYYLTPKGTGYEDFGAMPPELAFECFKKAERVHPRQWFLYFGP
jgi:hypothetical protein